MTFKAFLVLKFSLLHTGVLLSPLIVEPAIYFVKKKENTFLSQVSQFLICNNYSKLVTNYYFLPRKIFSRLYLDLVLLLSGDRNFSTDWEPQASITSITSASLKKESVGFQTVSKSKELSWGGKGQGELISKVRVTLLEPVYFLTSSGNFRLESRLRTISGQPQSTCYPVLHFSNPVNRLLLREVNLTKALAREKVIISNLASSEIAPLNYISQCQFSRDQITLPMCICRVTSTVTVS